MNWLKGLEPNYMNGLARGVSVKDDIDHLGNRRLRCVGELLQNQFVWSMNWLKGLEPKNSLMAAVTGRMLIRLWGVTISIRRRGGQLHRRPGRGAGG